LLYRLGLGTTFGPPLLLLTTVGRKSGKRHTTPLQYTWWKGRIYVGSARGVAADWVLNIQEQPIVEIAIGRKRICAEADVIESADEFVEFLGFRRDRNPLGIGLLFRLIGLSADPTEVELRQYLRGRVLVAFSPLEC
jgi:deazaflavin-dependent oxidoreductase (nitroreductase family)